MYKSSCFCRIDNNDIMHEIYISIIITHYLTMYYVCTYTNSKSTCILFPIIIQYFTPLNALPFTPALIILLFVIFAIFIHLSTITFSN